LFFFLAPYLPENIMNRRYHNRRQADRRVRNPLIFDLVLNVMCGAVVGAAWGYNAMLWSLIGGLTMALINQRVWRHAQEHSNIYLRG
jgi:hypothetical protein